MSHLEMVSIELTNACSKGCWFCYNHSHPRGSTTWHTDEIIDFVRDLAFHGVRAVSFGGGEPLEYEGLFDVLDDLHGVVYRSLTTNGLLLRGELLDRLIESRPNKVHISIHFPESQKEVTRVMENLETLSLHGINAGVNLVVRKTNVAAAQRAANRLREAGLDNRHIVYLPMRGQDTPTPADVHMVAGQTRFQSMSCLTQCGPTPRFATVAWDKTAAWCSYTAERTPLGELTHRGLISALNGLGEDACQDELLHLQT